MCALVFYVYFIYIIHVYPDDITYVPPMSLCLAWFMYLCPYVTDFVA